MAAKDAKVEGIKLLSTMNKPDFVDAKEFAACLKADKTYKAVQAEILDLIERQEATLNLLEQCPTHVVLQGKLKTLDFDLASARLRLGLAKGKVRMGLCKEGFTKYCNSLWNLGIEGSRKEFYDTHQRLLSLNLVAQNLTAISEQKAQSDIESCTGKPVRKVQSFFNNEADIGKGKGKARAAEKDQDDKEADDSKGAEEEIVLEEVGGINAKDKYTNPNVKLACLSSDTEVS